MPVHDMSLSLFPQNNLDLTNLFLNVASYLFGFSFGLQLGIIGNFPDHFLDLTLCIVNLPFAWFFVPDFMVFHL